jgi:hypothetical protein
MKSLLLMAAAMALTLTASAQAQVVEARVVPRGTLWCATESFLSEVFDAGSVDRSSAVRLEEKFEQLGLCGTVPGGTVVKILDPSQGLLPVRAAIPGGTGLVWLDPQHAFGSRWVSEALAGRIPPITNEPNQTAKTSDLSGVDCRNPIFIVRCGGVEPK